MVRGLSLLFLVLFSCVICAQTLRFRCVDQQDGQVLSYASACYLAQRSVCSIADSQGVLEVPFIEKDTLFFSRVGYAAKLIPVHQIDPAGIIPLHRNAIELPALELSSHEFSATDQLGASIRTSTGRIMMFPQLELGRRFDLPDSSRTLGAFTLHFAPLLQSTQLLSFAIYGIDLFSQLPSDKLYEQFFRIQAADIPVSQARVVLPFPFHLPKSFILSIRFVGVERGAHRQLEVLFTTRAPSVKSFERYFSEQWTAEPHLFFLNVRSRKNRAEKATIILQAELGRKGM